MGSGLADTMSKALLSVASERTLPFLAFISAGIVNFFVPLGGGQWAVGSPGPGAPAGRQCAGRGRGSRRNSRVLRRCMDEPDPALLGAARARDRGVAGEGRSGLLSGAPSAQQQHLDWSYVSLTGNIAVRRVR